MKNKNFSIKKIILALISLVRCVHKHQIDLGDLRRTYPHRGWLSDLQEPLLTLV